MYLQADYLQAISTGRLAARSLCTSHEACTKEGGTSELITPLNLEISYDLFHFLIISLYMGYLLHCF